MLNIKLSDFVNSRLEVVESGYTVVIRSNCKTAFYFAMIFDASNKMIAKFFVNNLKGLKAKLAEIICPVVEVNNYEPMFLALIRCFFSAIFQPVHQVVEQFTYETVTYLILLISFVSTVPVIIQV